MKIKLFNKKKENQSKLEKNKIQQAYQIMLKNNNYIIINKIMKLQIIKQ